MNDKSHKTPKLSDGQMDQLLSTFYRMEIPAELDRLPSSWPQMTQPPVRLLSTTDEISPAELAPRTSAGRGIAVVAATLAACVMFIVTSSQSPNHGDPATTGRGEPVSVEDPELMSVSPNAGVDTGGVIDSDGTTAFEIDGVKFGPEPEALKKQDPGKKR